MITTLRRLFASKLGASIAIGFIVFMGLAFMLGDVTNFSSPASVSEGNIARVGSRQISIRQVRARLTTEYQRAQQQNPSLTRAQFVSSGALDRIIRQMTEISALDQYARAHGVGIAPENLNAAIARNPAFAGINGSFNEDSFREALTRVGVTEREFRDGMETDAIVRQLVAPLAIVGPVPQTLATSYASLLLETREGKAVLIPAARFAPAATPTDAQLSAFYTQRRARYTVPERRAIRYAILDESALPAVAPVSAEEVAAEYRANAARYSASESRTVSQVIAGTRAVADRIASAARAGSLEAAAIAAGLSASTATSASQQQFAAGSNAELARAVFAADQGALVGPVQVPLGWAVVKVTAIDRKPARTLTDATAELTSALTLRKRQEAMVDLYNSTQDALNGGATVAEVAGDKRLRVVTTPPLLPNGAAPGQTGYQPDAVVQAVIGPAFQAVEGSAGQVVTIQENKVFALVDVAQIIAAAPPPLASVRDRVIADWRTQEGARIARDKAREILAAVERGQALSAAATAAGVPGVAQSIGGSRINLTNREQRMPPPIALLFAMTLGSAKTLELPGGQGWAVIQLERAQRGNAATAPGLVQSLQQQFSQALGDEFITIVLNVARSEFPISIDRAAMARLRSELMGVNSASPAAN